MILFLKALRKHSEVRSGHLFAYTVFHDGYLIKVVSLTSGIPDFTYIFHLEFVTLEHFSFLLYLINRRLFTKPIT